MLSVTQVLEKRGDPTAPEAEDLNKKTFIMALMPRGINPLKDVSHELPARACCCAQTALRPGCMASSSEQDLR